MADLVISGVTYGGNPAAPSVPYRPMKIGMKAIKVGSLKRAANGSLTWVHLGIKREWTITWEKASEVTRAALRSLHQLTTTFSFTDQIGVSYTVLTAADDYSEDTAYSDRALAIFYDLSITLREA
jgi:hypothetical protein